MFASWVNMGGKGCRVLASAIETLHSLCLYYIGETFFSYFTIYFCYRMSNSCDETDTLTTEPPGRGGAGTKGGSTLPHTIATFNDPDKDTF